MKIEGYDIIICNEVRELKEAVRSLMIEGWEPLGGPSFGSDVRQAMVMRKKAWTPSGPGYCEGVESGAEGPGEEGES